MKIQKTSKNLIETLRLSLEIAKKYHVQIDENILFAAMLSLKDSAATRALQDLNIDIDSTVNNVISGFVTSEEQLYLQGKLEQEEDEVSILYKKILEDAYRIALSMAAPYVGTEHLLVAWYEDTNNEIKNNLQRKGIGEQALYEAIKNTVKYPFFSEDKLYGERSSVLRSIGRNLTEMAREGKLDPVIGREKEMERMSAILMRRTKNNPILLGDAGVGKTAIVEGFAQMIANNSVPYIFKDMSVWQIDSATLFAGSAMRGDIENKLLSLIDEVSADKSIILFIDEIHTIMGASQSGGAGSDIANVLKPALSKGLLRCIGATTYAEYVKYIESDPALARRFQPIYVEEISATDAKYIVNRIKPTLEKHHHVSISENIVDEAIELSERYITDRYLPDKVIDLLDEASAKVNIKQYKGMDNNIKLLENLELEQQKFFEQNDLEAAAKVREARRNVQKLVDGNSSKSKRHNAIKVDDIKDVVSQWTGIPINSLSTEDVKKISNLSKILSLSVVGQKNAIDIVADALQVAKVGISDGKKPLTSFLFAGPTGVGKTELARQIAETLFGSKDNLVQLDMSEYMEAHSVSKLIGSPPGYIGFDNGGQLTEKIRKRPYSVVLFDEIEKAHIDVLNILLQILEEGKLTDAKGRIANFKNTVVVMTTNLGANAITNNDVLGFRVSSSNENEKEEKAYEDMQKTVQEELKGYLSPEFINRIDHIVIFKTLSKSDMQEIVKIQLDELANRVKRYKKINISFGKNLIKHIADEGYDEEYGARNIKRKINELVESNLSKYILNHKKINNLVNIDYSNSEVIMQ